MSNVPDLKKAANVLKHIESEISGITFRDDSRDGPILQGRDGREVYYLSGFALCCNGALVKSKASREEAISFLADSGKAARRLSRGPAAD
jgi:hypothetical protein